METDEQDDTPSQPENYFDTMQWRGDEDDDEEDNDEDDEHDQLIMDDQDDSYFIKIPDPTALTSASSSFNMPYRPTMNPFGGDATFDIDIDLPMASQMTDIALTNDESQSQLSRAFSVARPQIVFRPTMPPPPSVFPRLDFHPSKIRTRLDKALNIHKLALLQEVCKIDREHPKMRESSPWLQRLLDKLNDDIPFHEFYDLYTMLVSMDIRVLRALIWGDLFSQPALLNTLPQMTISNVAGYTGPDEYKRPVMYIQAIVDARGRAASLNRLIHVLDQIDLYAFIAEEYQNIRDALIRRRLPGGIRAQIVKVPRSRLNQASQDYAELIDKLMPLDPDDAYKTDMHARGGRRYILVRNHLTALRSFVAYWRKVVRVCKANIPLRDWDVPLPFTAYEVGYTKEMPVREEAHATHSGSVRLLSLFDAICQHEFPNSGIKLKAHILFACWEPNQVVSEHLFSIIAQSYVWFGGFNSTIAGISTASARQLPILNYQHWANYIDKTVIQERADEEREKLEAAIDKVEDFKSALATIDEAKTARASRWTKQTQLTLAHNFNDHAHARLGSIAEDVTDMGRKALNSGKYAQLMEESAEKFVEEMKVVKDVYTDGNTHVQAEKASRLANRRAASSSAAKKRDASQLS